jgi:phospholipid/cholesterol/gamma-HCH transport system ATP-binding protein
MSENIVSITDMQFYRGEREIYKDITLNVKRGLITAIMGPSGIGKTTLLKIIGGQLTPSRGEVLFKGDNVHKVSRNKLYEMRREMSMLFQSGALFTNISVFDNVAFPLREHTNLDESIIDTLVKLKLEAVGLRGAANLMPAELSGGMARRAALARAIALDPEMIMYDEPFAGQDPISMGVLVKLIKALNKALDLTSIVVTHDVNEVLEIADYAYIMANKTIVGSGTPDEIRNSDSPLVQQFLRGDADGPVPFHFPAEPIDIELLGDSA